VLTPHVGDRNKKNEIGGHVARMGDRRFAYLILVERPEGKRPIGSRRHEWEDIQEMGLVGLKWINLAQDRER